MVHFWKSCRCMYCIFNSILMYFLYEGPKMIQLCWMGYPLYGVSWPSGLVRRICVLMAESVRMWVRILVTVVLVSLSKRLYHNCFSSPRRKWGTCEGGVRLLCLISPMRRDGSNWAVYSPGSWDGFRNDLWALMSRGNNTLLALWFCLQRRAYLNARYYYYKGGYK